MIVRFGLALDGMQPAPEITAAGAVTLGPAGFLAVLEQQLGLPAGDTSAARRLTAYRECLAEAEASTRFYGASFDVDPVNVTRTLLDWRDAWFEHGWQGRWPATVPRRLADLADVERAAADRVPLGRGQRVQRVLAALEGRRPQVERVEVVDALHTVPATWRALLARLDAVELDGPDPGAAPGCDLHLVQQALAGAGDARRGRPQALQGDGSFVVVRGDSRDLSARAIAEYAARHADPSGTLVLAERDGVILDNALAAAGLARCGYRHYTRFRALSQVLPLALNLLWSPASPRRLLQFLLHPVGPVPRWVRAALADALAAQPGIGGQAWLDKLARIEARLRERGEDERRVTAVRELIAFWLQPPTFDPGFGAHAGAPVTALVQRSQACANWLARRANASGDPVERAACVRALREATDLVDALAGRTSLRKVELDNLLAEVGRAAPDPGVAAQAGHVRSAAQPDAVAEPFARVVWWDLPASASGAGYPWSSAELAALREHGVALPDAAERLRWRARQWLRPVNAAREQLVLVVHGADRGEHPLWTRIRTLFSGWREVRVERALLHGEGEHEIPQLGLASRPLAVRHLPAPRRWWRLPCGTALAARTAESYSGLDKLINCPYQWVLLYPARLRPGRAQSIPDGALLNGTLAHRVFEQFFTREDWREVDTAALDEWLGRTLPALIEREGAVLLEAGRGLERERFVDTVERALPRLIEELRRADVVRVQAEHATEAGFAGERLHGFIDLLVETAPGRRAVIDVKWGSERFRADLLAANRHVQLATYAYLCRAGGQWPAVAFFIAASPALLAQDREVFPGARVCAPEAGSGGTPGLWQALERTVAWRREQLAAGLIEVTVAGTEADEASRPPPGAYVPDGEPARFDDFLRLTGWEPAA